MDVTISAYRKTMKKMIKKLAWRLVDVNAVRTQFREFSAAPGREIIKMFDCLLTWIRLSRFRRTDVMPNSRNALIVSLSPLIYHVKYDAMLGAALKLQGIRPVAVLVSRTGSFWNRRYLKAFGVSDFIYIHEIVLSHEEESFCQREAKKMLAETHTFSSVKDWRFMGHWIGPQVLSYISRKNLIGTPDLDDTEILDQIEEILPEVIALILKSNKIVSTYNAALAITCECNYAFYAPFTDAMILANRPVIQYTSAWYDDGFFLLRRDKETRRVHPAYVGKKRFETLCERSWTVENENRLNRVNDQRYSGRWYLQSLNQPNTRRQSRAEVLEKLQLTGHRKIVVVVCPVLWDANLFYGEDLFDDFGDWFVNTLKIAVETTSVDWLIKLHPGNMWRREIAGDNSELTEDVIIAMEGISIPEHVRLVYPDTDISARSIYDIAHAGITVRGTAGMEMPCFRVPTIVAGSGRYSGLGFTIEPKTREDYQQLLSNILELPPMDDEVYELARWHAHIALLERAWTMHTFKPHLKDIKRSLNPFYSNLYPRSFFAPQLTQCDDLRNFADWAVNSDDYEFISDDPNEIVVSN